MTNILIADDDLDMRQKLDKEFTKLDNEVSTVELEKVFETYEKTIPDLTIINFDDLDKASAMTEEIMIYDDTACVLALTSTMGDHEREMMYKSGVRAIIPSLDVLKENDIRTVMNSLHSVCSELQEKECAGCWLSKKFTNLFELEVSNSE
ncbi:MAG: hypothetical protein GPJ54_20660 [Candidatus Heimdallarchaeota archaeon]|nr:hypothetical protein [Candidatus Heimdallarchaeota archaeon]